MPSTITPYLWISAPHSEVIDYYKSIFTDAEITINEHYDETPGGELHVFTMSFRGFTFRVMCTSKHDEFTDAVSFELACKDQAEIDYFWESFIRDGEASQCGWCRDKYGVRWQVVPENMQELVAKPGGFEVLLNQSKIIISAYEGAVA